MDTEYREYAKKRMAKTAFGLGIASVCSLVMMPLAPYLSLALGAFAILFAILCATKKPYERDIVVALLTGTISVLVSLTITAVVFINFSTNKTYRDNVLGFTDSLYGESFEEMYGTNMTDFFDEFFGGNGGNK